MLQYSLLLFFTLSIITTPTLLSAQKEPVLPKIDSLNESHIVIFKAAGITDTSKTMVHVLVKETGNSEEIEGATVVLLREKDKMLGQVTRADGRCSFTPRPAEYFIRVQLTGYKSLEQGGLIFEGGKIYELELCMAQN